MAKDAVEMIKNAEQRAYEIVNNAKTDAKEMTDNALNEKKSIIEKSIAAANEEISKRDGDMKKVCDEKIASETENYRAEVKQSFSDIEKRIGKTAEKVVREIFA